MAKRRKPNGIEYLPEREEVHVSQLIRRHPSIQSYLAPNQRKRVEHYANEYKTFLSGVMISPDVVDEVLGTIKESGFYTGKNFHMTNDDKTAFALVKYGTRPTSEGLRIIYSHCDSPCLQLKVKPLMFDWGIDSRDLHLGAELSAFGYGGVQPYQWVGRTLNVVGWAVVKGRTRKVLFDVYVSDTAQHTDSRKEDGASFEEAHKQDDSFILVPGHASKRKVWKNLDFEGEEDFARARLYAVPNVEPKKLVYYITGYGHDDRAGVFTSVQALLESSPRYTTIVIGFDKEEVGSGGSGGAKGKFFEDVINEVLATSKRIGLEEITTGMREELFKRSIAVNADVDVGSTEKEVDHVDPKNVAKLGYGMFVAGTDGILESDQVSPRLVDRVLTELKKRKVCLQTVGCALPAERAEGFGTINYFFTDRGIATINCGVPVGSLHSTEEVVHIGDIYHTIKGYKALIEDQRRFGPRKNAARKTLNAPTPRRQKKSGSRRKRK